MEDISLVSSCVSLLRNYRFPMPLVYGSSLSAVYTSCLVNVCVLGVLSLVGMRGEKIPASFLCSVHSISGCYDGMLRGVKREPK